MNYQCVQVLIVFFVDVEQLDFVISFKLCRDEIQLCCKFVVGLKCFGIVYSCYGSSGGQEFNIGDFGNCFVGWVFMQLCVELLFDEGYLFVDVDKVLLLFLQGID